MKLKNTTTFNDWFIRRMISWVCKSVEFPVRDVRDVTVRNKHSSRYSGRAWPWARRIVLSIGTPDKFAVDFAPCEGVGGAPDLNHRIETLVHLAAHEVWHLRQYNKQNKRGKYSEIEANGAANRVTKEFLEKRDELIAEWDVAPARATRPRVRLTAQEQRYARAMANLCNWQRKAKLAATKMKKYRKQVQYYEKALGNVEAAKREG